LTIEAHAGKNAALLGMLLLACLVNFFWAESWKARGRVSAVLHLHEQFAGWVLFSTLKAWFIVSAGTGCFVPGPLAVDQHT
jgi:thiosulfate reductase cytochrome b subunit